MSTKNELDSGKYELIEDVPLFVPGYYKKENWLKTFRTIHGENINMDEKVCDENFGNPTGVFHAGEKYIARIIAAKEAFFSDQIITTIVSHNGLLTGAHGVAMTYLSYGAKIPLGQRIISFDSPDRLWMDERNYHRVPFLYCTPNSEIKISTGYFNFIWNVGDYIIYFLKQ